jgi:hypothetical protein
MFASRPLSVGGRRGIEALGDGGDREVRVMRCPHELEEEASVDVDLACLFRHTIEPSQSGTQNAETGAFVLSPQVDGRKARAVRHSIRSAIT